MTDQDPSNTPAPETPEAPETPKPESPESTADAAAKTEAEARPEQSVTVEDIGPARKKLVITLPESRIKDKIESNYEQLRTDAAIPGFRRGRAPRRLIERRFGSSVRDDVKGQLLSEAYSQAVEDQKLDVLGNPDVKDVEKLELPDSGPFEFEVEIEVAPTVELPAFDSLTAERKPAEATDADVEQEVERLRERFGRMSEVADAKVEAGDFVQADVHVLTGENAGDDAEVISHQHDAYILVPGEDREYRGHAAGIIVDDLGKKLAGKAAGDTEIISMTGPSGHENEKIKDQPITLKIELKQIQRLQPAALEDVVTQAGLESEAELKDRLRTMLQERAQQEQQTDLRQQATDQLADKVDLELPEGLTSRQTERALYRRRMELMYQGLSEEEVEQQVAEMRSASEDEARRQLKIFFILDKAAKELEIEVNEGEINGQIAMMAMRQGRRPEKLRQEMHQRGELEQLYMQIREQKTLDAILQKAKVTEAAADQPGEPAEGEAETKSASGGKKKSTSKKQTD